MSVTKFRDVGDMPPVERATGEDLARRIRAAWARSRRFVPPSFTPGVQKFSDIQSAQRARERDERERARRLREQRQG